MLTNNKLIYIDALFLMEQARLLVPGLKKVLSFYYDPFEKKIASSIIESSKRGIEELDLEDEYDLQEIMRSRKEKLATAWLQESDLPFSLKKNQQIQRQVFDELENIVLLLRIPNKDDGKMDLLYLFVNADASNFGLKKSSDILKTENKSIISQLIYNSFKQILTQRSTLMQQNNHLKEHYALMQKKLELQKRESRTQQQDHQKQMLNYCKYLIEKHSIDLGVHIEMGRELMEILSNYKGSIQSIEKLIEEAIQRTNDINTDILSPVLSLEEWHFDDLDQDIYEAVSRPDELSPESRYLNTFKILDRYEESARKLVSNREKLTGANVGKALSTPISAAAITDAIKKHQDKINTLCKQYPNRWKIIRSEFRPLMNVLRA
jgi:hypothetical protein